MNQPIRPHLTAGVAVACAGLIAVAPTAPQLPRIEQHAVTLTAASAPIDLGIAVITDHSIGIFPFGPMLDLLGLGKTNLVQALDFLGPGDQSLSQLLGGLPTAPDWATTWTSAA